MTSRLAMLFSLILALASGLPAQQTAKSADQESNIQSYIDLMRADVKAE